jgi:hypothetical protein
MVDPPPEISLLSLSLVVDGCLVRMALSSVNGGAPRALGLKILRVQERGGGEPTTGVGQADRPRPIRARFGRPFAPVGPQVIMHFAPSIFMILMMSSSRPRWRFFVQEVRSCAPSCLLVWTRSSGESSGRSSGGRVGRQLGRLGPLTGQQVF